MAPRILLSATIPVVLLPHDAPRTLTTTAPTTDLTALLIHSPAEDSVTLTLSDLSTRLLLLRHVLTAAQYGPLRESQSLLIDFAAFPTHLCDLLQRVTSAQDFVATLRLPSLSDPIAAIANNPVVPSHNDVAEEFAILCVVQTSAVKSITHIELQLRRASHEELVAAVAGRAREAELADARATHLQNLLEEERSRARDEAARATQRATELMENVNRLQREVDDAATVKERVITLDAEVRRLRNELQGRDESLAGAREDAAAAAATREENDRLRAAAEHAEATAARAEEARRRAIVDLDETRRDVTRVTSERDTATREITRGNDIIQRLQSEVRSLRAKSKVKATVLGKQEEAVRRLETKISELERDVRRARDRAAMLEVEKDGLNERLNSALRKLEENAAVLASDQQVIAYLNRELNERAMGEAAGATTNRSPDGRRRRMGERNEAHSANVSVALGGG